VGQHGVFGFCWRPRFFGCGISDLEGVVMGGGCPRPRDRDTRGGGMMLAWHFLAKDKRLQFGRRSRVYVGQTLRRNPNKLSMCEYGLHASIDPFDALKYAPSPVICRVKLGGTILEEKDKCVASRRTVLWMKDIEKELRLFACWCVRNTPLPGGRVVWDLLTDKRSRNAVVVAERFANGDATLDELLEARNAAWETAWEADADYDVAMVADAAWAAVRAADAVMVSDAAYGTTWAYDATWAAAMVAVWTADASWAAAWEADAAWAESRAAQKNRFSEIINEITPEEFRVKTSQARVIGTRMGGEG